MSRKRIFIINGVYHCMSRLVCGAPGLDRMAKAVFVKHMRRQEVFCGVEVLTYCVMSNHFHILLRVPQVPEHDISDKELVRRWRVLYPAQRKRTPFAAEMDAGDVERVLAKGGQQAVLLRRALLARMHDVSAFMRELKQRFSIWFNRREERHGTLWSERFKSVLIEGRHAALKVVAAYIDLNPVRAGLVSDPKDYVWSGYAAACGGQRRAVLGLTRVMGGDPQQARWVRSALDDYRMLLYGKGALPGTGKTVCLDVAAARRVMAAGGRLSVSAQLLCRLRVLCHSTALGSCEYVAAAGGIHRRSNRLRRKRDPVPWLSINTGEQVCRI